MKDMRIIEFLIDILYFPFKNNVFDIKNLKKEDPNVIKIFQLTYRLIKHVIKEYRANELYAAQWIDLLIN